MASHLFFDHTGDFGVELHAERLRSLYAELAPAFSELLLGAAGCVAEASARSVHVEGVDATDLLVALGNELLFLFETEGFLPAQLEVRALSEDALSAIVLGEPYDPNRHVVARPIKAVTHHGAEVLEEEGGVRARLIFDL